MKLRLASMEDFDVFYEIKKEDFNLFWTGHETEPDREKLKKFFEENIKNAGKHDARKIYILLCNNTKIRYGYLDPSGQDCEWSVALKEEYSGKGHGKESLKLAMETAKKMQFIHMTAFVREDNTASLKMFSSCGFVRTKEYQKVYIPGLGTQVKMYKLIAEL